VRKIYGRGNGSVRALDGAPLLFGPACSPGVAAACDRRRRAQPGTNGPTLLRETTAIGLAAGAAGCLAAKALFGQFARALTAVGLAPNGFVSLPRGLRATELRFRADQPAQLAQ
jgi:hypothetical protein